MIASHSVMNPNLHVEPMGVLEPLLLGGSDLGKIGVHSRVVGVLLIQGNAVITVFFCWNHPEAQRP